MQFNDTTTRQGIIQYCERQCRLGSGGISGTTALLEDFTAYANTIMSRLWHVIFNATGSWLYDDANRTDLPQATTSLINGTALYVTPSQALTISRGEVMDEAGNWHPLIALAQEEVPVAIDEFRDGDGLPRFFRMIGDTVELFPAPNYNSTGGLKLYFDRGAVLFSTSDTTAQPGFASEYHDLVHLGASLEYMDIKMASDPATKVARKKYTERSKELKEFYKKRFKIKSKRLARKQECFV